jgi:hypothetical protein
VLRLMSGFCPSFSHPLGPQSVAGVGTPSLRWVDGPQCGRENTAVVNMVCLGLPSGPAFHSFQHLPRRGFLVQVVTVKFVSVALGLPCTR